MAKTPFSKPITYHERMPGRSAVPKSNLSYVHAHSSNIPRGRFAYAAATVQWTEINPSLTIQSQNTEEEEIERRWDALFAASQDLLAELADKALADYRAGRTKPLDPDQL